MKISEKIGSKKIKSWIIFSLVILNIIAFVFISNRVYFRIDMTEGQKYSISKPSVELLRKLDNAMVIEYYYNDKCKEHAQMAQVVQYVEDMLKEFENASKGYVNVVITQLSYEKNMAEIAELEELGIQPFSLSERQESEAKTLLGFSGIIIKYKNTQAVMGTVYQDVGFEYNLDIEIKKLVDKEGSNLGILLSIPNKSLEKDYKYIDQITKNEYNSVTLINSGENIPNEISTILILGGSGLTDYDIFQIDQFLMNGGKALIALNGVNVIINPQYGIFGVPNESKLFDLLSYYGIKLNKDLVGDNDSFNALPQRKGFFVQEYRYPVWLKIKSQNINKEHPTVDELTGMNLFWASSIDIDEKIGKETELLMFTTENAWSVTKEFKMDPQAYQYPIQQGVKEFLLACAFKGSLNSYFENKEIPENLSGTESLTGNKLDIGKTQLVVIGNEFFLENNFAGENGILFMMNSLDWLSKDHSLIEIRNKGKFARPLDKAKNKKQYGIYKSIIIIITTYIIPILFIVLAIVLNILRFIKNKEIRSEIENKKNVDEVK